MLWWVVVGFFTAFGLLCAGMVFIGALLRGEPAGIILLDPEREDGMYLLWLRAMGVIRHGIYRVTDPALWQVIREHTEEITGWDTAARPMTGAEEIDRPGYGDSTGDHQRGGISEL